MRWLRACIRILDHKYGESPYSSHTVQPLCFKMKKLRSRKETMAVSDKIMSYKAITCKGNSATNLPSKGKNRIKQAQPFKPERPCLFTYQGFKLRRISR